MEKTVYESNVPRVYTLYRVSTIGQVEKDDIPMQKQVCRDFAKKQGWVVIKEFSEKGISGYKVSAKDRDAIQEIQHDAALGKFDILLVFMFDRLGRRDDETPFIVEWFVKNGVEVWSAMEGQQRFDNHVDKLMNYICWVHRRSILPTERQLMIAICRLVSFQNTVSVKIMNCTRTVSFCMLRSAARTYRQLRSLCR